MSNNIDSFVDEDVAENVDIVITVFDVDFEDVNVAISLDMIFASSFDVVVANSLDVNVAKRVDSAIDAMNVRFAITAFDVKRDIDFEISLVNFF